MNDTPMFDRREMLLVHDMLRREIGLLPRTVRSIAPEDTERVRVVGGHIATVTGLLHHHHASEDELLWPLLEKRCYDRISGTVTLMEDQHRRVDALVKDIGGKLPAWTADPAPVSRDALADALDELLVALKEHLGAEESQILPVMEEHITADEWNAVVREGAATADPATMPLMFGMVMYEGDPELVEAALANMPPEVGPFMRQTAPQAYAAHAQLVYGTPTPARGTELS